MAFVPPYQLLTTKPLKRRISTQHPEWAYVFSFVAATTRLQATIHYTDGTTATISDMVGTVSLVPGVSYYDISYLRHQYHAITPLKTIASIVLSFEGLSGEQLTLVPFTPATDQVRAFYYRNSQGGIDSLITTGDFQNTPSYLQVETRNALRLDSSFDEPQVQTINQEFADKVTVHTGYLPKAELQALSDMKLINWVCEYLNDALIPIKVDSESLKLPSDRENTHATSFSYTYAFRQRAMDRKG